LRDARRALKTDSGLLLRMARFLQAWRIQVTPDVRSVDSGIVFVANRLARVCGGREVESACEEDLRRAARELPPGIVPALPLLLEDGERDMRKPPAAPRRRVKRPSVARR
jgi:hypothetical protein